MWVPDLLDREADMRTCSVEGCDRPIGAKGGEIGVIIMTDTKTAYNETMIKDWLKVAFLRIVDAQCFFSTNSYEHQQLEQAGDLVLRVGDMLR